MPLGTIKILLVAGLVSANAQSQQESQIKSDTGVVISDIGFNAKKLSESVTKDGAHVLILKSNPCLECDIGPELILYNLEAKKKVEAILPGTWRSGQAKPDEISDLAHGFYGKCGSEGFGVWILHQSRADKGPWTFEEIRYDFSRSETIETKKSLTEKAFNLRFKNLQKSTSCKQLQEEAHTWCC